MENELKEKKILYWEDATTMLIVPHHSQDINVVFFPFLHDFLLNDERSANTTIVFNCEITEPNASSSAKRYASINQTMAFFVSLFEKPEPSATLEKFSVVAEVVPGKLLAWKLRFRMYPVGKQPLTSAGKASASWQSLFQSFMTTPPTKFSDFIHFQHREQDQSAELVPGGVGNIEGICRSRFGILHEMFDWVAWTFANVGNVPNASVILYGIVFRPLGQNSDTTSRIVEFLCQYCLLTKAFICTKFWLDRPGNVCELKIQLCRGPQFDEATQQVAGRLRKYQAIQQVYTDMYRDFCQFMEKPTQAVWLQSKLDFYVSNSEIRTIWLFPDGKFSWFDASESHCSGDQTGPEFDEQVDLEGKYTYVPPSGPNTFDAKIIFHEPFIEGMGGWPGKYKGTGDLVFNVKSCVNTFMETVYAKQQAPVPREPPSLLFSPDRDCRFVSYGASNIFLYSKEALSNLLLGNHWYKPKDPKFYAFDKFLASEFMENMNSLGPTLEAQYQGFNEML